jgi:signal-transduction protein with cAMP-binding, CBS, and nucleotidyltransferase domain
MKEKRRGSVVVTKYVTDSAGHKTGTAPLGIITERDIVRRVVAESKDPNSTTAYDIMSKPLITVGPEATIYDAALIMTKYGIRRLPIVRDNTLLGIITSSDLARRMYEENRSDPMLMAMSRFQDVEKLTVAQHNQNRQGLKKSEHNPSTINEDMWTQEQFLQNIPQFRRIWSHTTHHKCQIKL